MEVKNYKPFDLEKAKAGAKVMTRDGRPARFLCPDLKGDYPVVAGVFQCDEYGESEIPYNYTIDGQIFKESGNNFLDLVMCPEKHEGWINVYKDTNATYAGSIFKTKEEAIAQGSNTAFYITTIKIEWEE